MISFSIPLFGGSRTKICQRSENIKPPNNLMFVEHYPWGSGVRGNCTFLECDQQAHTILLTFDNYPRINGKVIFIAIQLTCK